jgi:hypothetical protein
MRCFVASINEDCLNKWGDLLPPSMMSASINEVICCFHQAIFIDGSNKSPHLLMHSSLMEATNHLIYWCTHHWWRQQNTSFIEAIFIDGSNKSPHLLMHSSLMEATKHLIYWCTHWWRQQNKWGVLLPPSMKSASINEVFYCLPQQRVHQ